MRCPYCRLIMADTEARCVRCGAVDQGGRWVRGATPTGTAPPRPRVDPAGTEVERAPLTAPRPPSPAPRPSNGRGCAIAAIAIVVVVVLALVGGTVAIVAAGRDEAGPTATPAAPAAWSLDAEGRFEAACRASGADADRCRCVRVELEQRFTETEVDTMVAVLERGDRLHPSVQRELREAERSCAADG